MDVTELWRQRVKNAPRDPDSSRWALVLGVARQAVRDGRDPVQAILSYQMAIADDINRRNLFEVCNEALYELGYDVTAVTTVSQTAREA